MKLKVKPGKAIDRNITRRVEVAVRTMENCTVEKIRKWIIDKYEREYSWNTIRQHLNILIEERVVKETLVSQNGRRVSYISIL